MICKISKDTGRVVISNEANRPLKILSRRLIGETRSPSPTETAKSNTAKAIPDTKSNPAKLSIKTKNL